MGPIPFTQASAGGPVVVAAHLYGAAGGVAVAAAGSSAAPAGPKRMFYNHARSKSAEILVWTHLRLHAGPE